MLTGNTPSCIEVQQRDRKVCKRNFSGLSNPDGLLHDLYDELASPLTARGVDALLENEQSN
ncbi:uncharacterized protein PHALS_12219 [Plasmopara halstedii]|uniref:Uncharacterized protein n=1 Tax=Plasmopara halstedii TaxID=4781 RepID=A0A0P1AL99_PLAHL|nr:uncharacterized protein PHALS_12219 [Plasmopara halstedii]CEG41906.1 hypothetical protein PHALS_12219 [Plasmopara halstedii]|eukprot:XP_024578275.1 hypothetical protein PHALS_12219 [Plasmopara halstedii]